MIRLPPRSTLFPYTALLRSDPQADGAVRADNVILGQGLGPEGDGRRGLNQEDVRRFDDVGRERPFFELLGDRNTRHKDRKSTSLKSSHSQISYADFSLQNKT